MIRLDLVVGPNGAGKSTFIEFTLAPLVPGSAVVNADEIARRRWPADPEVHGYEAARVAEATRAALIGERRPFIAETVFSHPSKLDLLRAARTPGYTCVLHVLLVPEELAVARVSRRVAAGGHAVPEDKIRARYQRLWPLVSQAVPLADSTTVYDNSSRRGPRIVARFSEAEIVGATDWPPWTAAALRDLPAH